MEHFTNSYIEKCIKYANRIAFLIGKSRGLDDDLKDLKPARHFFQVGDFFHCPDLMGTHEVKEAKIISQAEISTGDPFKNYPIAKCIYIPTKAQLEKGFMARHLAMGAGARSEDPEALFDEYIEYLNQNK